MLGCQSEPSALGPPICEPPEELSVERTLKQGYKALSDNDRGAAMEAFERVLSLAPKHPQALAGLHALRQSKGQDTCGTGPMWINGEPVAVDAAVQGQRLRFEARRQWLEAAGAQGLEQPIPIDNFGPRDLDRAAEQGGATPEGARLLEGVNLVVLSASATQTAMESFVRTEHRGRATHFIIDYNGDIYQSLDLVLRATHSGISSVDERSISVTLVNPFQANQPPLPAGTQGLRRPLSERSELHNRVLRAWGYTAPQKVSLARLLKDLSHHLEDLELTIPSETHGLTTTLPAADLTTVQGVIGGHHVSSALDGPGPAMDWRHLSEALKQSSP